MLAMLEISVLHYEIRPVGCCEEMIAISPGDDSGNENISAANTAIPAIECSSALVANPVPLPTTVMRKPVGQDAENYLNSCHRRQLCPSG